MSSAPNQASARSSRLARVPPTLQPAIRAFIIGYLLDALPTILKQLLRYILINLKVLTRVRKRIIQERQAPATPGDIPKLDAELSAASSTSIYSDAFLPALQQLPALLKQMGTSLITALGPRGVALSCALAMAGTASLENALASTLIKPNMPVTLQTRRAVLSTFVSAAACSALALHFLQYAAYGMNNEKNASLQFHKGFYNPFKRRSATANPTPLAPGGHFLARLTSLSIPGTPKESVSRSPSGKSLTLPSMSPTDEKVSSPLADKRPSQRKSSDALGTASPTIDLTLFALVRAMDTLVRGVPMMLQKRRYSRALGPQGGMKTDNVRNELARLTHSANRGTHSRVLGKASQLVRGQAEGLTFVVACAIIMYNWFYAPERLPPSYVKWITNLASMDNRLLLALRSLRTGKPYEWNYDCTEISPAGVDLLSSFSESMGHPYSWGDPTQLPANREHARQQRRKAQAMGASFLLQDAAGLRGKGEMGGMPCEIVHCGVGGANCYKNALYRFLKAYKVCLGIYIPVHLLPRLIFGMSQLRRQPVDVLFKVLKGSMRSAAFLSTYISSIWFMVCLGRTLLLPRLFPSISHTYWDAGLGPILGSWTCGWSVFIEEKRKRAEMALYVAPRALFALGEMAKPGWLSEGRRSALLTERILFGMSVGIVVSAAKHRPDLLRGLTSLMAWIVPSDGVKRKRLGVARS